MLITPVSVLASLLVYPVNEADHVVAYILSVYASHGIYIIIKGMVKLRINDRIYSLTSFLRCE